MDDLKCALNAKVKSVSIYNERICAKTKTRNYYLYQLTKYNCYGNIIEDIRFENDGQPKFSKIYSYINKNKFYVLSIWRNNRYKDELYIYDEQMKLIEICGNDNNRKKYDWIYNYNRESKLISKIYKDNIDHMTQKFEYGYDENGLLNEEIFYENNEIIYKKTFRNIYDKQNRKIDELETNDNCNCFVGPHAIVNKLSPFITEFIHTDENGNIVCIITETKNLLENILEVKHQNADGRIIMYIRYFYNQDKMLKKIKAKHFITHTVETTFYNYEYFD